jgi:hypothetical protein
VRHEVTAGCATMTRATTQVVAVNTPGVVGCSLTLRLERMPATSQSSAGARGDACRGSLSVRAQLLPTPKPNGPLSVKGRRIETEPAPIRYVGELVGAGTDSNCAIRWLLRVLC